MFLDQPDFWVPMKNCRVTEEEVPCKTKQNNEKKKWFGALSWRVTVTK